MTDQTSAPLLQTRDWNAEWQLLQQLRQRSDSAEVWDEKAKSFPVKHGSQEGYVSRFLQLADIKPGETVFDMGCGTGALATPLAQAGHRVIACDFSRGMLDAMEQDQAALGVSGVEVHQFSWSDNWEHCGIEPKSADVALASRSIATSDLQSALLKLNSIARRRVCITLPAGPSPRIDDELLAACGFANHVGHDFLYAFVILANAGLKPEVSYIHSARIERFETRSEALEKLSGLVADSVRGTVDHAAFDAIPAHIDAWLDDNLVAEGDHMALRRERDVIWAFISWSAV